jgi:uncharacterized protein (DUF2147 family)
MGMTRVRKHIAASVIASLAMTTLPLASGLAQASANPVGTWLTEGGHGVIRIQPCKQGVCGEIVGIDRSPNEPMPTDAAGRPQCGLTILTGSADPKDGITEGRITDPRDGKTYSAQMWIDAAGRLHMRGYLGVPLLGRTQVWQPFAGRITNECRFT